MFGRKRHPIRNLLTALFLLAVLAFFFYDSCTRLVTDSFELSFKDLPSGFDGFRIVQLSDLHGASFGDNNIRLVDAVKAAKPEYIFITGDLIDDENQISGVLPLMKKLTDIAPVYFVSGNHEWASGAALRLFSLLDEAGVTVLRNEYELIERGGGTIVLAGIDDPNGFADQKTPEELFGEIDAAEGADAFTLLLSHRHEMIDTYAKIGADLVLVGHVHGGIIRIPGIGGLLDTDRTFFPKYTDGAYTQANTTMFVSRGLGLIYRIPRFLNNPQVAVLTLRCSNPA